MSVLSEIERLHLEQAADAGRRLYAVAGMRAVVRVLRFYGAERLGDVRPEHLKRLATAFERERLLKLEPPEPKAPKPEPQYPVPDWAPVQSTRKVAEMLGMAFSTVAALEQSALEKASKVLEARGIKSVHDML